MHRRRVQKKFHIENVKFVPLAGKGTVGLLSRDRMVIRNFAEIHQPQGHGLLDNCLLILPRRAVDLLCLTPNIGDKEQPKTLWMGRVWQIRSLLTLFYKTHREVSERMNPMEAKHAEALEKDIQNNPKKMELLKKLQQAWRKA